jgi:hypothetical protein
MGAVGMPGMMVPNMGGYPGMYPGAYPGPATPPPVNYPPQPGWGAPPQQPAWGAPQQFQQPWQAAPQPNFYPPAPVAPGPMPGPQNPMDLFSPSPAAKKPAAGPSAPTNKPAGGEDAESMAALEALLKQLGAPGGAGGGMDLMPAPDVAGPGGAAGRGSVSGANAGSLMMQPDGSVWDMDNRSSGGGFFSWKNIAIGVGIGALIIAGLKYFKGAKVPATTPHVPTPHPPAPHVPPAGAHPPSAPVTPPPAPVISPPAPVTPPPAPVTPPPAPPPAA